MALFEVTNGALLPFRARRAGADLYEREIEDLAWSNLEEFSGEPLFPIGRQRPIRGGGRPDVIALDESGRVVVIEIKREVDRNQLSQCLEYAGWARTTGLDELSSLYHRTPQDFFADWQAFTNSTTPLVIHGSPRLILIANSFNWRTEQALDFLIENGLPIKLIPVSVYEDPQGRTFVDVESGFEPELAAKASTDGAAVDHTRIGGRRIQIVDLLDHGLLQAGDELVFKRVQLGQEFQATVREDGAITLPDGRTFSSPSRSAREASGMVACDGWLAWRVRRLGDKLLNELRVELVSQLAAKDPD